MLFYSSMFQIWIIKLRILFDKVNIKNIISFKRVNSKSMLYYLIFIAIISIKAFGEQSTLLKQCPRLEDFPGKQITQNELANLSSQCFLELYDGDTHNADKIIKIVQQKITDLKKLLKQIQLIGKSQIVTEPVMKWAQSDSEIFLNFKLSHRQDSPPCSDLRKQDFTVYDIPVVSCPFKINIESTRLKTITFGQVKPQLDQNGTQIATQKDNFTTFFTYHGQCILGHQKLLFSLNVTFTDTIDRISIRKQGMGSYTVIAHKKHSGIWVTPFQNKHYLSIWAEMRQKYENSMDNYFRLLDQKKDQQDQKEKKKKRRKNRSKSQEKQQNVQEEQKNTDL